MSLRSRVEYGPRSKSLDRHFLPIGLVFFFFFLFLIENGESEDYHVKRLYSKNLRDSSVEETATLRWEINMEKK